MSPRGAQRAGVGWRVRFKGQQTSRAGELSSWKRAGERLRLPACGGWDVWWFSGCGGSVQQGCLARGPPAERRSPRPNHRPPARQLGLDHTTPQPRAHHITPQALSSVILRLCQPQAPTACSHVARALSQRIHPSVPPPWLASTCRP